MQGDKKRWVRKVGDSIEELLASDQNQEAWKSIASWYRKASGVQAAPSRGHLEHIATERVELYSCRPPKGLRVPILGTLMEVEDGIPGEAEVVQAVWGLKRGRVGGPLGVRVEDLKGWLQEASRETNPVKHW